MTPTAGSKPTWNPVPHKVKRQRTKEKTGTPAPKPRFLTICKNSQVSEVSAAMVATSSPKSWCLHHGSSLVIFALCRHKSGVPPQWPSQQERCSWPPCHGDRDTGVLSQHLKLPLVSPLTSRPRPSPSPTASRPHPSPQGPGCAVLCARRTEPATVTAAGHVTAT